jgi:hypothetical protein
MFESPAPRRYGALDQLRVDLTTRRTQILYAIIVILFACAGIFESLWPALAAVALILFFGRGFIDGIRSIRHGVVAVVRIERIEREMGTFAVNENVSFGGALTNVGYELAPVKAILGAGYGVEAKVLFAPRTPGFAFAYRAVERTVPVP